MATLCLCLLVQLYHCICTNADWQIQSDIFWLQTGLTLNSQQHEGGCAGLTHVLCMPMHTAGQIVAGYVWETPKC